MVHYTSTTKWSVLHKNHNVYWHTKYLETDCGVLGKDNIREHISLPVTTLLILFIVPMNLDFSSLLAKLGLQLNCIRIKGDRELSNWQKATLSLAVANESLLRRMLSTSLLALHIRFYWFGTSSHDFCFTGNHIRICPVDFLHLTSY